MGVVPILPDEFDLLIQQKLFSSAKADRAQVAKLYRTVFAQVCMTKYYWTDVEVAAFQKMLPHFPQLRSFRFGRFRGDPSGPQMAAFCQACAERGITAQGGDGFDEMPLVLRGASGLEAATSFD